MKGSYFLKQLLVLTKNSFLVSFASYWLTIYLANHMQAGQFGLYSYILALGSMLGIFVNFATDLRAPKLKAENLSCHKIASLTLSVRCLMLVVVFFSIVFVSILFRKSFIIPFGIVCLLLASLNLSFLFEVKGQTIRYSYIYLAERAFYIVLILGVLQIFPVDLFLIFFVYFLTSMISIAVQGCSQWDELRSFSIPKFRELIGLLKNNVALMLILASEFVYGGVSRLIFEYKFGINELAIFSLGMQIAAAITLFQSQVEKVFRLKIITAIESRNSQIFDIVFQYLMMTTLPILIIASLLSYWSNEIVGFLFVKEYSSLANEFYLFTLFFIINNINSLVTMCWIAINKQKELYLLTVTFAFILFVLLMLLPVRVGMFGFIVTILSIQALYFSYSAFRLFQHLSLYDLNVLSRTVD